MCKFQVHFAVDLGFFPIKYERFVGSTGELTTVFEVQEIRTQKSATGIVAYPIKLFRKELGADGVSLPMEETIHVDEATLPSIQRRLGQRGQVKPPDERPRRAGTRVPRGRKDGR